MWIVDDDGDMFNTDNYRYIKIEVNIGHHDILMVTLDGIGDYFKLSDSLTEQERLTRYYDLVEKLTGERIDG